MGRCWVFCLLVSLMAAVFGFASEYVYGAGSFNGVAAYFGAFGFLGTIGFGALVLLSR